MSVKLPARYRILSVIGEGSAGVVYRVFDTAGDVERALKLLRAAPGPEGRGTPGGPDAGALAREFDLLRSLQHPGLVAVHDFGWCDGGPFFTMDLCEGHDPRRSGLAPPDPRFLLVVAAILRALQFLHSRRVVHGDLKPGNIRVTDRESASPGAVLLDFGLSHDPSERRRSGTVEYMAPEVASGMPSDHRADLYSLGVILYEWIAGVLPFRGDSYEVLRAHAFDAPARLLGVVPGTPPTLSALLDSLLAKDPRGRPDCANDVIERLNRELGLSLATQAGRVAPGSASRLPLVGREDERERIRAFLDRARSGTAPPGLLLSGPPGVGKSRLLEEARAFGQISGFHVSVARAEAPLVEWARSAGLVAGVDDSGVTAVARLLRLHPRPALFVLDDGQLADAAALSEVVAVARYLAADRESGGEWRDSAFVVAARASGDIEARLTSAGIPVEVLELQPLDAGGVHAYLLEALGARSLPSRVVAEVARQTGGVPSLLVMAAESVSAGLPEGGDGEAALIERVGAGLGLPSDAAAALAARTGKLSEAAQTVLAACGLVPAGVPAAVIVELLREVNADRDGWAILRDLARDGWVTMAQGQLRAAALTVQPAFDRLGLARMRAIADRLAEILGRQDAGPATILALRLQGSGEEQVLAAAARLVGGIEDLAKTERRRLLSLALERPEVRRDADLLPRCVEALAVIELDAGETDRAAEHLRSLLDLPDLPRDGRLRVMARLARALRLGGHLPDATALCEQVLSDPNAGAPLRAEVESDLAIIERRSGRLAESIARCEKVLEMVGTSAPEVRARMLTSLGHAVGAQGDRARAFKLFEEAASHYRAEGNRVEAVVAAYNAGVVLSEMGRVRRGSAVLRAVRSDCDRSDLATGSMLSMQSLASCAAVAGDLAEAQSQLSDAARHAARLGNRTIQFRVLIDEAWIRAAMADFDGALDLLDRAEQHQRGGEDIRDRISLPLHRGEALARLGDLDHAAAAMAEAVRVSTHDESASSREVRVWFAWVVGSSDAADRIREEMRFFKNCQRGWSFAVCRMLLGEVLLSAGRTGEVIEVLEMSSDPEADDIGESFGVLRARALLLRGRAFERSGDLERARTDYDAAHLVASARSQSDESWQADALAGLALIGLGQGRSAASRLASALALLRATADRMHPRSRSVFLAQRERASLLARLAGASNEPT